MNQRSRSFCSAIVFGLLLTFASGMASAQQPFDVKTNYKKREVQIPMREPAPYKTLVRPSRPSARDST